MKYILDEKEEVGWGGGKKVELLGKNGEENWNFHHFFPDKNAIRSLIYSIWGGIQLLSEAGGIFLSEERWSLPELLLCFSDKFKVHPFVDRWTFVSNSVLRPV